MGEISPRDRIGQPLRTNGVAIVISVVVALLLSTVDLIAPPLGVPLALLFVWFVQWVSRGGWSGLGMRRPKSWPWTIAVGVGVAVALELLAFFVLVPVMQWLDVPMPDFSRFESIRGSISVLLVYLTVSWTTAGFGEEIIWRGFVMGRVARVLGDGPKAWAVSLIVVSILFGLLHLYQGVVGVVLTTVSGLALGGLYLATGRNLWASIIAHGMTDTISFLVLYSGWLEL